MRSAGKQPNLARGARSIANLRRGGPGRPKKTDAQKAEDKEVRRLARGLLDPAYRRNLKQRLLEGKAQPGVEVAIWQYAWGKPKEIIETKDVTPVRISHEYQK